MTEPDNNASLQRERDRQAEAELIEAAIGGDFASFETLVSQTEARLYNHLLRLTGNPDDAKELLQETYLSAYRSLKSFKARSTFSTWVYRIATNHALMHFRKKMPETPLEELSVPSHEELKKRTISDWDMDPSVMAHQQQVQRILDKAIAALPPHYRAVVALRDVEGLSTAETAEILEINPGAVKTRLHRARIHLREMISPHFAPDELISAEGGQN